MLLLRRSKQRKRHSREALRTFAAALLLTALCVSYIPSALGFCFEEAGRYYNISPSLLWAIGKVESNFDPRALNWNRNGSYDFGVMQINSRWYGTLGQERWERLGEPCTNVYCGAWILAQCIEQRGYTWKAVECYNAGSKAKQELRYARRVAAALVKAEKVAKEDGHKRRPVTEQGKGGG